MVFLSWTKHSSHISCSPITEPKIKYNTCTFNFSISSPTWDNIVTGVWLEWDVASMFWGQTYLLCCSICKWWPKTTSISIRLRWKPLWIWSLCVSITPSRYYVIVFSPNIRRLMKLTQQCKGHHSFDEVNSHSYLVQWDGMNFITSITLLLMREEMILLLLSNLLM